MMATLFFLTGKASFSVALETKLVHRWSLCINSESPFIQNLLHYQPGGPRCGRRDHPWGERPCTADASSMILNIGVTSHRRLGPFRAKISCAICYSAVKQDWRFIYPAWMTASSPPTCLTVYIFVVDFCDVLSLKTTRVEWFSNDWVTVSAR